MELGWRAAFHPSTTFSFPPGDAEAHPDNCLSAYTQTSQAYK